MKKYEFTCLISDELNNEQLQKTQEEVECFLVENQGIILSQKIDSVARILGTEVKKKKSAFLASFLFLASPSQINEIEKKIKEKKEVLRHTLLLKRELKKEKKRLRSKKTERDLIKKVKLEDIDKKIGEILNE